MAKSAIVYLFGYPATGKLTIAKELAELLDATVVDNHLIDNPIFQVIKVEEDAPIPDRAWPYVDRIRDIVYEVLVTLAPKDQTYILTNVLFEDDARHAKKFEAVRRLAKQRNAFFLPVRLLCDEKELVQRVTSEDRKEKLKQSNPEKLKESIEDKEVLDPDIDATMELDVTNLSAEASARKIAMRVKEALHG